MYLSQRTDHADAVQLTVQFAFANVIVTELVSGNGDRWK